MRAGQKQTERQTEDDRLFAELYPSASWEEILNAFPGVSKSAIVMRAYRFGITRKAYWTPEENEILRNVYPAQSWAQILKALPGRSEKSIVTQAVRLSLSRGSKWTAEDDKRLRAVYPRGTWVEILASFPGKTKSAIYKRVHRLGLEREIKENPPGFIEAQSKRMHEHPLRLGKVLYPIIARDGVDGKFCSECREWRPLNGYGAKKDTSGGVRNICKTCEYAGQKKRLAASPEARKRACEVARNWQKRHPEKAAATKFAGKKRRYERMMEGPGVSSDQLIELRALWGGMCAYCSVAEATTFDHVKPIARGGQHAIENLVPACKPCNFSKHAKLLSEWRPGFVIQRKVE